jgi:opacity protein-like surface antigen
MKRVLTAFALTTLTSVSAAADSRLSGGFFDEPAAYGGLGAARAELDDDGYFRDIFSDLQAGSPEVDDDDAETGHLFGGYRFNKYFAAQVDIRGLGDYEAKSATAKYTQDFGALTASAVGFLPLGKYVSLYGQAGIGTVSVREKIRIGGFRARDDDSSGAGTLGVGIQVTPMGKNGLALRLGWQSYFFRARYDRYYVSNPGSNIRVYLRDERYYDQRIDTVGLDIAYYFQL